MISDACNEFLQTNDIEKFAKTIGYKLMTDRHMSGNVDALMRCQFIWSGYKMLSLSELRLEAERILENFVEVRKK